MALERTNQGTLRTVSDFAASQHRSHAKRGPAATPLCRMVPTAVIVAGGINAADHASTFADLIKLLRAEVCHPAGMAIACTCLYTLVAMISAIMVVLTGLQARRRACEAEQPHKGHLCLWLMSHDISCIGTPAIGFSLHVLSRKACHTADHADTEPSAEALLAGHSLARVVHVLSKNFQCHTHHGCHESICPET